MPTTTLYLVRHGETEYNRRRIVQGRRIDSRLNVTGRQQAAALAERFAGVALDALYTSTMRRAEETVAAVAAHHPGLPLRRLRDLEEMSWGVHEGAAPSAALEATLEGYYGRWAAGHFDEPVEGGESIRAVQRRGVRAIAAIVAAHPGGRVLVVAHGRLLRVVLASLLDGYTLHRMHEIEHANTSVNEVTCVGGRYEARLLNCTAHLAPLTAALPD